MIGYFNDEIGCLIGIHSGKLFQIQDNIKEININGTAIIQIEQMTESLFIIGCESGQINLYDILTYQSIFIFNEYISTPLKYFKIRYFYDMIVQGKQDGQLTYYILNDSIINILQKRDQCIQQQNQQQYDNILISQPQCRQFICGIKLLDFVLYGDIVIILTELQIECLLIDLDRQEKIRLRTFPLLINIQQINIYNEQLILYNDQSIHLMDINNGQIKKILNQQGLYQNIMIYIQDNKIYYK